MSGDSHRGIAEPTAGPGRRPYAARQRRGGPWPDRPAARCGSDPRACRHTPARPRSAGDNGAVRRDTSTGGGGPRRLPTCCTPVTGTADDQRGLGRRSGWSRVQVRCTELRGPSHPGQLRNDRADRLVTLVASLSGREGWDNTDSSRDDRPLAMPGEGRRRAANGASPLHYAWGPIPVPVRGRIVGRSRMTGTRSGEMAERTPNGPVARSPVGCPVGPAMSG